MGNSSKKPKNGVVGGAHSNYQQRPEQGSPTRATSLAAVNFNDFKVVRAIGKGSFGKVCIVQKNDTKIMYALKYMNKMMCIEKGAVRNVLRELDILKRLSHPYLVNLWFSFQDAEDMFLVVDLLLGGDLRYHIDNENGMPDDHTMRVYIIELAMAVQYLHNKHILHRDIKPENILLDTLGHLHLTDFNMATVLEEDRLATSLSGTRSYMAPEMFRRDQFGSSLGYSFPADWWSMGVTMHEISCHERPYDAACDLPSSEMLLVFASPVQRPQQMDTVLWDLLTKLLCVDPDRRCASSKSICCHPYLCGMDHNKVLSGEIRPTYQPSTSHLNCDPVYELEELIIESKPLHKKKQRLAKFAASSSNDGGGKKSAKDLQGSHENTQALESSLDAISKHFVTYDRTKLP